MKENNTNRINTIAKCFWMSMYSLIVLVVFGCVCVLSIANKNKPVLIILSCVIGALILAAAIILLFKVIKKKYNLQSADGVMVFLITIYIGLSLTIVSLITLFSKQEPNFESIEKMVQISWTIFGVSIALYAIIIGLPSIISRKEGNVSQELASDIADSLNPIIYSLLSIIVATVLLYCFYDAQKDNAQSFAYVALISTLLSVPYYLIAGLRFLYKNNK